MHTNTAKYTSHFAASVLYGLVIDPDFFFNSLVIPWRNDNSGFIVNADVFPVLISSISDPALDDQIACCNSSECCGNISNLNKAAYLMFIPPVPISRGTALAVPAQQ